MTRRARDLFLFGFGAIAATATSPRAHAAAPEGFAVDRHEPAERGSAWLTQDDLDLRRRSRPALGASLDLARKTLVARDANGEERAAVVATQLRLHVGGAWALTDRLRVSAALPIALAQDGDAARVGTEDLAPPTGAAFGDLRLAVDLLAFGARPAAATGEPRANQPLSVAFGVRAWLPTGSRAQFMSDGTLRLAPQLLLAGEAGPASWAARAAFVLRPRDDSYASLPLGSEIELGLGAGVRAGRWLFGPELVFASRVRDRLLGPQTAAELLLAAHVQAAPSLRVSMGVGTGLTPGFGTPAVRGILAVDWGRTEGEREAAREAPEDRDRDDPPPERIEREGDPEGTPPALAVVTPSEIRIASQVQFATDSADLLGESDAVLSEVAQLLAEHPEIERVRVEGHTDDVGDPRYNEVLSRRRAESVVRWLVLHGVADGRLVAEGYGATQPLVQGAGDEARRANRRVVFTIVSRAPR